MSFQDYIESTSGEQATQSAPQNVAQNVAQSGNQAGFYQPLYPTYPTYPTCPNCGYCAHCGRSWYPVYQGWFPPQYQGHQGQQIV